MHINNIDELPEESLWKQICVFAPPPEIEEISKIIGVKFVDENLNLWTEIQALNNILSEMTMFEFDQVPKDFSRASLGPFSVPKLTNIRSLAVSTSPYSYRDMDSDNQQLSSRSHNSLDPIEFVSSIRGHLSIDGIGDVVEDIRRAFKYEKKELESQVVTLTRAMEGEVEVVVTARSPRREDVPCTQCGCNVVASPAQESFGLSSPRSGTAANQELLCSNCKETSRRERKLNSRLPKRTEAHDPPRSVFDVDGEAIEADVRSSRTSKLKSKLLAARDEHHFF